MVRLYLCKIHRFGCCCCWLLCLIEFGFGYIVFGLLVLARMSFFVVSLLLMDFMLGDYFYCVVCNWVLRGVGLGFT